MAWVPKGYRKDGVSRIAETPSEAAQFEWEGWDAVGDANVPVNRTIIATPVRPVGVPNGTIWIKSII